jgi:hypothetical protein
MENVTKAQAQKWAEQERSIARGFDRDTAEGRGLPRINTAAKAQALRLAEHWDRVAAQAAD